MAIYVDWLDAQTYHAKDDRRVLAALCSYPGVINTGSLKVTQHAGGANMTVDVAAGQGMIAASDTTAWLFTSDAIFTTPSLVPDPAAPTNYAVIARIYDNAVDSLGFNMGTIELVRGIPGAPGLPALPVNCILLASIPLPAAASSVVNANINDTRQRWLPASYMSTGFMGQYSQTGSSGPYTAEATVGTFQITVTPDSSGISGRRCAVCFSGNIASTISNDLLTIRVRDSSLTGTTLAAANMMQDLGLNALTINGRKPCILSTGTHTLYLTAQRSSGTGTFNVLGNVNFPFQAWVEDMGDG